MSIWQPHKPYIAPAHERQRKLHMQASYCAICGRPIHGGKLCASCGNFIKRRRSEEGKAKR